MQSWKGKRGPAMIEIIVPFPKLASGLTLPRLLGAVPPVSDLQSQHVLTELVDQARAAEKCKGPWVVQIPAVTSTLLS
jgi:hypothetical protein